MTRLGGCVFALVVAISSDVLAEPANVLTPAEKKDGWKLLFDGKSTTGWTSRGPAPPPAGATPAGPAAIPAVPGKWVVEKGELVPVKDSGRGHLVTDAAYGDFVLRVDFWIDGAANSGIFFRTPETGDITQGNAFEVNLCDGHKQWPTGSINGVQKTSGTPQTAGKWSTCEITAKGDQLTVVLNGEKVVDTKGNRLPKGNVGFQFPFGGVAKFRNIRIKKL
jgi:hypothetical protein